jgi:hypothetical protein
MKINGFGAFVPYDSVEPGTLFLEHAPGTASATGTTAILLKVEDPTHTYGRIRIHDPALGSRMQRPALAPPVTAGRYVLALPQYVIEPVHSLESVIWESDPDFVRAALYADTANTLSLKAFRNRGDDGEFLLFDLATGRQTGLATASIGFRRWSIAHRTPSGERIEIYRFET